LRGEDGAIAITGALKTNHQSVTHQLVVSGTLYSRDIFDPHLCEADGGKQNAYNIEKG
jgi:hypothetical protein